MEEIAFTPGSVPVVVVARVYGKDASWVRAGIISGWLPIGKATRNTLCYDAVSGRYFKGDIEKIKKAECELNRQMRDEMYISLNDFYYEIGLDNIKLGDELGWNIDDGYIDLSFSSQLASDGTPCLVIDYTIAPRYDFRNLR